MKYLFHLTLFSIVFSCSNQRTSLTEEPTVNAIFTAQEVKDLIRILDFFENQICELQKEQIHNCYQSFFLRMKKQVEEGEFDTKISFEEQKQLYDHIDSTTFNEIWTFS